MPTTETRRLNPLVLWVVVLAIIILAFVIARSSTRELVEIHAAAVTRQSLVSSIPTNGKVEPIGEFQAYAPAAGIVTKVYVDVLQKVKAGDLLLKMDDSDAVAKLAAANATLRSAEATLHDMDQGGSQERRIALTGDLSTPKLQQQRETKDPAAIKQLDQKRTPPST